LSTTDGGATWPSQVSGTVSWLSGVSFVDVNIGTAVGSGGTILRTTDRGTTWRRQASGQLPLGGSFLNAEQRGSPWATTGPSCAPTPAANKPSGAAADFSLALAKVRHV